MARSTRPKQDPQEKPAIFGFHNYREYLRELFAHAKAQGQSPTRKEIAGAVGLSLSNLSMILSGSRKLTQDNVVRLGRALGHSTHEQRYFEALVLKDQAESAHTVVDSLRRMNGLRSFRDRNPRESEVLRYLTHWYYVAIREMSALPSFRLDARWIKRSLPVPVPLSEIQKAIDFLLEHRYIELGKDGMATPPQKTLDCMDGVYKVALGHFHREILDLASRAITDCPAEARNMMGFSFSCSSEGFQRASQIIERAYSEIRALSQETTEPDRVYHAEFCLFPLILQPDAGPGESV
jgi:uncharacterized protein (TIGR02147 family)